MAVKKFNILLAEGVDALRGLAQSTIQKHCANINLVVAADSKEVMEKLDRCSPDLIVISENIDLDCKKLVEWLNLHASLRERLYVKATTDSLERLIPPDYFNSSLSLSGIYFWALVATKEGEKRRLQRYEVQEEITLVSGKIRTHGSLINIAGGGVLGLFPRERNYPPIAEKVTIDLGPQEKPVLQGFSGFPVRIQTEKATLECSNIQIAVKFHHLSEGQVSQLKKYLETQKKKAPSDTKQENSRKPC